MEKYIKIQENKVKIKIQPLAIKFKMVAKPSPDSHFLQRHGKQLLAIILAIIILGGGTALALAFLNAQNRNNEGEDSSDQGLALTANPIDTADTHLLAADLELRADPAVDTFTLGFPTSPHIDRLPTGSHIPLIIEDTDGGVIFSSVSSTGVAGSSYVLRHTDPTKAIEVTSDTVPTEEGRLVACNQLNIDGTKDAFIAIITGEADEDALNGRLYEGYKDPRICSLDGNAYVLMTQTSTGRPKLIKVNPETLEMDWARKASDVLTHTSCIIDGDGNPVIVGQITGSAETQFIKMDQGGVYISTTAIPYPLAQEPHRLPNGQTALLVAGGVDSCVLDTLTCITGGLPSGESLIVSAATVKPDSQGLMVGVSDPAGNQYIFDISHDVAGNETVIAHMLSGIQDPITSISFTEVGGVIGFTTGTELRTIDINLPPASQAETCTPTIIQEIVADLHNLTTSAATITAGSTIVSSDFFGDLETVTAASGAEKTCEYPPPPTPQDLTWLWWTLGATACVIIPGVGIPLARSIIKVKRQQLQIRALTAAIVAEKRPPTINTLATPVNFRPARQDSKLRILGSGTSAHVLSAEYMGKQVAVKVFKPGESTAEGTTMKGLALTPVDNFLRCYGQLIVTDPELLTNMGLEPGKDSLNALVLEYAPHTLISYLEQFPAKTVREYQVEVVRLGIQLAEAVKILHRFDRVHRDIKPENALIKGKDVKMADFGSIKQVASAADQISTSHINFSDVEVKYGFSPAYAPHEFFLGEFSKPGDIFCLAMTLIHMFEKKGPYSQLNVQQIMRSLSRGFKHPIPKMCPAPLKGLLLDCLEQNPANRPTCEKLLSSLVAWQKDPDAYQRQQQAQQERDRRAGFRHTPNPMLAIVPQPSTPSGRPSPSQQRRRELVDVRKWHKVPDAARK